MAWKAWPLGLKLAAQQLEQLVYYEKFVIINPGSSGREFGELIDENDLIENETGLSFHGIGSG